MAHVRSGGKKGGALEDHVNKAKDRVEKSVERIKSGAKGRIRAMAGCDEEGEGFSTRGAGWGLQKKKVLKGAGLRMRGAGVRGRKKKCGCK